jgi:tetratricopeptide (TPR) repeat protein
MAISAEIEKLRRRWLENPTGLMFAPLAEALRKTGNPDRALEVLEAGLEAHPDYVPALIVRARCHADSGNHGEAEAGFEEALAHDPMNPIAMRGLAEVLERNGLIPQAIQRIEALLEVERGDPEVRSALVRLRSLEASGKVEMPPPVAPAPVVEEPVAGAEPAVIDPSPPPVEPAEESVTAVPVETESAEEPALVVTASMAELFLRQGHPDLALVVYRRLAERDPADLQAIEAIEGVEREIAAGKEPAAQPDRRSHAAGETGGESVEAFLRSVLNAPAPASGFPVLPPAIESGPPEAPVGIAEEPLSLSLVFGTAPPGPATVSGPPPPEPPAASDPTYDQFFGALSEAVDQGNLESGRLGEVDDLRQFNDWLRGLKR